MIPLQYISFSFCILLCVLIHICIYLEGNYDTSTSPIYLSWQLHLPILGQLVARQMPQNCRLKCKGFIYSGLVLMLYDCYNSCICASNQKFKDSYMICLWSVCLHILYKWHTYLSLNC